MTLTNDQLSTLIDIYANAIVESMDEKGLVNFVYDTIVENMSEYSEEDFLNELYAYYDEEDADAILDSVR